MRFCKSAVSILVVTIIVLFHVERVIAQPTGLVGVLPVLPGSSGGVLSIQNLGLLPYSLNNAPAFMAAGENLLLGENDPLTTALLLGGPLKGQLVPVLDVLLESPEAMPDYILGGGTVISRELTIIPPIPLLNSPLGEF